MAETPKEGKWDKLDPVAIGLLKSLCEKSGAKVVLSSTWREGATDAELENLANYLGVDIIGVTRSVGVIGNYSEPRGSQIRDWLVGAKEVTHYVILDDDSDMLVDQLNHFVKVDCNNGLSYENYLNCLSVLDAEN